MSLVNLVYTAGRTASLLPFSYWFRKSNIEKFLRILLNLIAFRVSTMFSFHFYVHV